MKKYSLSSPTCKNTNSVSLVKGQVICIFNKKHKFWYKSGQLKEIEDLICSANKNTELKFERNGNRLLSFEVIDTLDERVIFKGFFI